MSLYVNLISTFDDKGLKSADGAVGKTEGRLGKFAKVAGAAFAAAGAAALAYAGTLLVDGVKSAIEDEKAQTKLATALKNATDATDAQIASVEDYITQASIQFGITDDKLRPSFEKLAIATGDLTKAQQLQTLAMDVAAGTGKDLDAVSLALAKAYNGNIGALTRLGVPLDENIIKSKDFAAATQVLADTFGGQAAAQADTFEGKMTRLSIAFDEAKETAGAFILDAIQPLADIAVNDLIPALSKLGETVGSAVGPTLSEWGQTFSSEVLPVLQDFGNFIQSKILPLLGSALQPILEAVRYAFEEISKWVVENRSTLDEYYNNLKVVIEWIAANLVPFFTGAFAGALKFLVDRFINLIDFVINLNNAFKNLISFFQNSVATIKSVFASIGNAIVMPMKIAFRAIAQFWNNTIGNFKITIPDWVPLIGGKVFAFPKIPVPQLAEGGIVTKPTLAIIGEAGPEAVVPLSKGKNYGVGQGNITINVNGALDAEAVARQIQNILQRSTLRAGNYA